MVSTARRRRSTMPERHAHPPGCVFQVARDSMVQAACTMESTPRGSAVAIDQTTNTHPRCHADHCADAERHADPSAFGSPVAFYADANLSSDLFNGDYLYDDATTNTNPLSALGRIPEQSLERADPEAANPPGESRCE